MCLDRCFVSHTVKGVVSATRKVETLNLQVLHYTDCGIQGPEITGTVVFGVVLGCHVVKVFCRDFLVVESISVVFLLWYTVQYLQKVEKK